MNDRKRINSDKYLILYWKQPLSKNISKNWKLTKVITDWYFNVLDKYNPIDNITNIFRTEERLYEIDILWYHSGYGETLIVPKTKENKEKIEILLNTKPKQVKVKNGMLVGRYNMIGRKISIPF